MSYCDLCSRPGLGLVAILLGRWGFGLESFIVMMLPHLPHLSSGPSEYAEIFEEYHLGYT